MLLLVLQGSLLCLASRAGAVTSVQKPEAGSRQGRSTGYLGGLCGGHEVIFCLNPSFCVRLCPLHSAHLHLPALIQGYCQIAENRHFTFVSNGEGQDFPGVALVRTRILYPD